MTNKVKALTRETGSKEANFKSLLAPSLGQRTGEIRFKSFTLNFWLDLKFSIG